MHAMTTPNQAGRVHSILVVDDDPISRELIALLLGSEGHRVTQAASGIEALDALAHAARTEQPTAILVDLKMPGLSGDELARRLRSQAGSGVRILAMSASEPSSTAQFDGFLLKPIDTELLARMLAASEPVAATPADLSDPSDPSDPSVDDDSPALNEVVFARLQAMMPRASVEEVFEVCIEDVRKRIPKMAGSLKTGDLTALRQSAHTIKGGSSMIGAARLSQIAAKIETGSYKAGEGRRFLKELSLACDDLQRILLKRNAGRLW